MSELPIVSGRLYLIYIYNYLNQMARPLQGSESEESLVLSHKEWNLELECSTAAYDSPDVVTKKSNMPDTTDTTDTNIQRR